jgi:hypothetical protein
MNIVRKKRNFNTENTEGGRGHRGRRKKDFGVTFPSSFFLCGYSFLRCALAVKFFIVKAPVTGIAPGTGGVSRVCLAWWLFQRLWHILEVGVKHGRNTRTERRAADL